MSGYHSRNNVNPTKWGGNMFIVLLVITIILLNPAPAEAPEIKEAIITISEPTRVCRPYYTLIMEATAYTHAAPGGDINGTGDGYTATMTRPRRGVVAVDPAVIPLGTVLYIEGYGWARAEDVGGMIKGCRVDVFMETREEALNWGRKWVEVRVYREL